MTKGLMYTVTEIKGIVKWSSKFVWRNGFARYVPCMLSTFYQIYPASSANCLGSTRRSAASEQEQLPTPFPSGNTTTCHKIICIYSIYSSNCAQQKYSRYMAVL